MQNRIHKINKRKIWFPLAALFVAAVVTFFCIFFTRTDTEEINGTESSITTPLRFDGVTQVIDENGSRVDCDTFFNEFRDSTLHVDEENNALAYNGTRTVEASSFTDKAELLSLTDTPEQGVDVRYGFDYNANENKFVLTVTADTKENGEVIDRWYGTPFTGENGETDVAFATDRGLVTLSQLKGNTERGKLMSCGWGWFDWVCVAVVAVAVAVVCVAVPVVIAAATAAAEVAAVAGGTVAAGAAASAAVSAGAAAAAAATATTTFAVATTTAAVAGYMALVSYIGEEYGELTSAFVSSVAQDISHRVEGNIYYPCLAVSPDIPVSVSLVPVNEEVAAAWINLGGNMYTFEEQNAAHIIEVAGYVCGPKDPAHVVGGFDHFHPYENGKPKRIPGNGREAVGKKHNVHSFFGFPCFDIHK